MIRALFGLVLVVCGGAPPRITLFDIALAGAARLSFDIPGTDLTATRDSRGVTIELPKQMPDAIASVVALDIGGTVQPISAGH